MRKTILISVLSVLVLLLAGCSQDKIDREQFDIMYAHLSQVWAQSLAHADAKIAFYGDSRVIGADWNAACRGGEGEGGVPGGDGGGAGRGGEGDGADRRLVRPGAAGRGRDAAELEGEVL